MPRFVILEHDHPHLHWDFMLEANDVLRTWRLESVVFVPDKEIVATAVADHRKAYLDYEGPVSGNRGRVVRWDAGTYEVVASSEDSLQLQLHGTKARGLGLLTRTQGAEWRLRLAASQGDAGPGASPRSSEQEHSDQTRCRQP